MKFKRQLILFLTLFVFVFSSLTVQANGNKDKDKNNGSNSGNDGYSDVDENHWAYDEIMMMSDYGIINGFNDGTFRPSAYVSRAEFAKMMVLTLQLDLIKPSTPTFVDVPKDNWAYKYVETSKYYLSYFTSAGKAYYKPSSDAVREDMAVAIVKALGIDANATNMSVLDKYPDKSSISTNLRKYVAAAINEGIMTGSSDGKFYPTSSLSRAEAATLLARLISEEKVVFDEEKVTDENTTSETKTPYLLSYVDGQTIMLDWTSVKDDDFKYYKVVLSKSDSTPSYPDNGYLTVISDHEQSKYVAKAGDSYTSGDFGGKLVAGDTYYVAITAVYDDAKYTSNVLTITIPKSNDYSLIRTPALVSYADGQAIVLDWSAVNEDDFIYYKIVLSKNDSTPSYPDNGYLTYITDNNISKYNIKAGDAYNSGDFGGKLIAGETYYAAITAVYENGALYTSNVIPVKIPVSVDYTSIRTPALVSNVVDGKIQLNWTKTDATSFKYYKVVLSKSDTQPSYPDNGYLTYLTDVNQLTYTLNPGQDYNSGDFVKLESNAKYYVTITAVYEDGTQYYTSNVLTITLP